MSTVESLALTAVAMVVPYLKDVATGAAERVGELISEGARDMWLRIQEKLTSPAGVEAVTDLEAAPDDPDNQAALRKQVRKQLETDEEWRAAVEKLVSATPQGGTTQSANVFGSKNTSVQVSGTANRIRTN